MGEGDRKEEKKGRRRDLPDQCQTASYAPDESLNHGPGCLQEPRANARHPTRRVVVPEQIALKLITEAGRPWWVGLVVIKQFYLQICRQQTNALHWITTRSSLLVHFVSFISFLFHFNTNVHH